MTDEGRIKALKVLTALVFSEEPVDGTEGGCRKRFVPEGPPHEGPHVREEEAYLDQGLFHWGELQGGGGSRREGRLRGPENTRAKRRIWPGPSPTILIPWSARWRLSCLSRVGKSLPIRIGLCRTVSSD